MVFKGTPHRSAADVNRELDEIGSQSNAYTSEEQTVYYAGVVPEYQQQVVELLADIMRPALRDEDFAVEKQVIIEEICKYDDQPPYNAPEKCLAAYLAGHPLGHSVLGSVETVQALTPARMRAYFEQRYSPSNMTLVGTGRIDFAAFVETARGHCGHWQDFSAQREMQPPQAHPVTRWLHRDNATQQYVIQVSGAPHAVDNTRYALRLLSVILGDDSGSRLFWELVDSGLAEYAASAAYEFQDAGILMTYLSCAPEDALANLDRLRSIQEQLQRHGVTQDELELACNKITSQIVRRAERPMNRLFSVGQNWIQRQRYRTVRQAVESYQAVTCDNIAKVIRRFPLTQAATVFAGPLASDSETPP